MSRSGVSIVVGDKYLDTVLDQMVVDVANCSVESGVPTTLIKISLSRILKI